LKINWRDGESTQKFGSIPLPFFQHFDHGAALKIERKMSHLCIAFNRYASKRPVMNYILVINIRFVQQKHCTVYEALETSGVSRAAVNCDEARSPSSKVKSTWSYGRILKANLSGTKKKSN